MISRGEEKGGGGEGGVGGWSAPLPPPTHSSPPSFSLLSCFLNSCQESLMAVEFGQEKSGAGSFRGSGDLCFTKAAPLFVFSSLREQQTEGTKDRGSTSESFSSEQHGPLGEADLRQTGHDHLTSLIHDHA